MGFPKKHRHRDFEKWLAEHHTDSIALGACVEVNLSAKGVKGFTEVSRKLDKKGRTTILPGYDPFKLHQHKTYLKGGIATWMQGYMAGRSVTTYKDKHHCWIAHTFNSLPHQYTVVFGYKVCSNTVDPTTSTISAREQMGLVREKHRLAEQPRDAFDFDLGQFLSKERNKGREVLYIGDHNSTRSMDSVERFFHRYEMTNMMPADAPPTCVKSSLDSPPTEVIFGTDLFDRSMASVGIYPQYFFDGSDHRVIEVAFRNSSLHQQSLPLAWSYPDINTKHPSQVAKFLKKLRKLHDRGKTAEALENIQSMLSSKDTTKRSEGVRKACHLRERMFDYINNAHKSVVSPKSNASTPYSVELATARKTRNNSIRKHREENTTASFEEMQKAVETFLERSNHAAGNRDKMLQEMIEDIALKRNCKESSAVKQIYNAEVANGFH